MSPTRRIAAAALVALTAAGPAATLHRPAHAAPVPAPTCPRATVPAARALFTGTADGLAFRSTDGGCSWQEADSGLPRGSLFPMVESASGQVYSAPGAYGVYATTNGGRSWYEANGAAGGPADRAIYGLAVAAQDGRHVYAVDPTTVFESRDAGRSWKSHPIATVQPGTDPSSGTALEYTSDVNALHLDPLRPATLLINTLNSLLVSVDAGASWAPARGVPPAVAVPAAAFSPSAPDVAYAATEGGIYQTVDGGTSWQYEGRGTGSRPLTSVAVDPNHPSQILAIDDQGGVFRSTDGGTSWRRASTLAGTPVQSLSFDPAHPGTVIAASEAGSPSFFLSTDGGLSWQPSAANQVSSVVSVTGASGPTLPSDPLPAPLATRPDRRYIAQTAHSIGGDFLTFYRRYDGLRLFGLPLSEAFVEAGRHVQYFERVRLAAGRGGIAVDPLGSELTAASRPTPLLPVPSTPTLRYFAQTGHTLGGRFLAFWSAHQGDLLLGPPITEPMVDRGNGGGFAVQYFRRARLEYHPDLAGTGYEVEAGQLGRIILQQRGWL